MANATRAAATRPKVEPTIVAEAPLAGAVRAEVVARPPGAVADAVPAGVVELPLGNGATLGIAGPARLEVIAAVVGATEVALVAAKVLGAALAELAAEVALTVAEVLGAELASVAAPAPTPIEVPAKLTVSDDGRFTESQALIAIYI